MLEVIAHRGACFAAPENSLEAFELAIGEGCARIELDVQLTADGQVVICHDPSTARTTGEELEIEFSTLAELQRARMKNGEPLPTLDDACRMIAHRTTLDVELKGASPELPRRVLDVLDRYGMRDSTFITSFDATALRRLRHLGFAGRTGLLVGSTSLHVRQRAYEAWPFGGINEAGATDLVIHYRLVHPFLRRGLEARGLGLAVWTAIEDETKTIGERAALYRRLAQIGASGIIVARVAEARAVLGLDASGLATSA
jgi:glycerophosphoryl diester phosphodiesterase